MVPKPRSGRLSKSSLVLAAIALLGISLALFLLCAMGLRIVRDAVYYTNVEGRRLELQYGFEVDTPYIQFGGEDGQWREVTQLKYVSPDGRLGRSGFCSGDILEDLDPNEFYSKLSNVEQGGHATTFRVLRDSGDQAMQKYKHLELSVTDD